MNELTTLLVGFVLTSVLGGALGVIFQRRTWEHQHRVQMADLERQQASQVFDEISRLLDRRVYRLQRLNWRLQAKSEDRPHADLESRMQEYQDAVREWNENANRNLALLQRHFGADLRNRFDNQIGSELVRLGQVVEGDWRGGVSKSGSEPVPPPAYEDVNRRIGAVADAVYDFNLRLLEKIEGQGQTVKGRRSA